MSETIQRYGHVTASYFPNKKSNQVSAHLHRAAENCKFPNINITWAGVQPKPNQFLLVTHHSPPETLIEFLHNFLSYPANTQKNTEQNIILTPV